MWYGGRQEEQITLFKLLGQSEKVVSVKGDMASTNNENVSHLWSLLRIEHFSPKTLS